MATDKINVQQRSAFEFKSSTLTVPVLVLAENNISAIENLLSVKIQQAPEFFKNSPVIIDLNKIVNKNLDIDLAGVLDVIRNANLQPIGIRYGNDVLNKQAQALSIAQLADERKFATGSRKIASMEASTQPKFEHIEQKSGQQQAPTMTEIISQPVRSGQRVYSSGDLVILATISAGAEVMAEGNIHIYGVLRGRALAGVLGNEACRIFCTDLQAELISIAGNYRVSENIRNVERGKPVQVILNKQKLIVNEL